MIPGEVDAMRRREEREALLYLGRVFLMEVVIGAVTCTAIWLLSHA